MQIIHQIPHLSHGRKEALGVEEAREPEELGPPVGVPAPELLIPLQKLGEPEAQRARLPGYLSGCQSTV